MQKASFHQRIANRITFGRSGSRDFHAKQTIDNNSPTVASILEQMISLDDTPFLVSQRKIPPSGLPRLDRPSIRVGELVRRGEFTRTFAVVACRQLSMTAAMSSTISEESGRTESSRRKSKSIMRKTGRAIRRSVASFDYGSSYSPDLSPLQYTIKTFHDFATREDGTADHDLMGTRNQSKQHQQLLMEAVYLAALDHPGIVTLRGFPTLTRSSIFVITDRIGETLEERITQWRRQRRKVREYEAKLRRPSRKSKRRSSKSTAQRRKSSNAFIAFSAALEEKSEHFVEEVIAMVPEDLVTLKTNYALQIANALEYLHARGIVVRELRPDTIGFLEFPNHHQVQLCDLTSAKELPMDDPWLPSTEPLILEEDQSMDNSDMSATSVPGMRRTSTISESSRIPVPSFRRMNTDPTSFRTTSTTTTATANSPPPTPDQGPFGRRSTIYANGHHHHHNHNNNPRGVGTDSSSAVSSSGSCSTSSGWGTFSDDSQRRSGGGNKVTMAMDESTNSKVVMDWSGRSAHSNRSQTPSSSVARNCYRAPEMYTACATGYNAKVDCYSWAMIYYELLAERRPANSRCHAETLEQLWEEVRTQRPSLKQCYFPLSIQQVVQQAWEADVSRRYSSEQICKALTRVLPVLEGKRLDGRRRNGKPVPYRPLPERAARVVNSRAAKGWNEIRRPDPATRPKTQIPIATY